MYSLPHATHSSASSTNVHAGSKRKRVSIEPSAETLVAKVLVAIRESHSQTSLIAPSSASVGVQVTSTSSSSSSSVASARQALEDKFRARVMEMAAQAGKGCKQVVVFDPAKKTAQTGPQLRFLTRYFEKKGMETSRFMLMKTKSITKRR